MPNLDDCPDRLTAIADEQLSELASGYFSRMTAAWMEPRTRFAATKIPVWGVEWFNPAIADEVWLWGKYEGEDRAIHAVRTTKNNWSVRKYSRPNSLNDSVAKRQRFLFLTDLKRFGLKGPLAQLAVFHTTSVGVDGAVFADSDEGELRAAR